MTKPSNNDNGGVTNKLLTDIQAAGDKLVGQESWMYAARRGELVHTNIFAEVVAIYQSIKPYIKHLGAHYPRNYEWRLDDQFSILHNGRHADVYPLGTIDRKQMKLWEAASAAKALVGLPEALQNWQISVETRLPQAQNENRRLEQETREAERLLREMCLKLQEVCSEILKQSKSD